MSLFTKEIEAFILKNYKGTGPKQMTEIINSKFKCNYVVYQIANFYSRKHIRSGVLVGTFKKGHIPHNKGKKGVCAAGCEKTWFKPGHQPINHREVGSERINVYGYAEIKIKEPDVWMLKHKYLWELNHGPVPENHVVIFKDGDKTNLSLDNLSMISRAENLEMNSKRLRCENAKLTESGILVAKLNIATKNRKKKKQGGKTNGQQPEH